MSKRQTLLSALTASLLLPSRTPLEAQQGAKALPAVSVDSARLKNMARDVLALLPDTASHEKGLQKKTIARQLGVKDTALLGRSLEYLVARKKVIESIKGSYVAVTNVFD